MVLQQWMPFSLLMTMKIVNFSDTAGMIERYRVVYLSPLAGGALTYDPAHGALCAVPEKRNLSARGCGDQNAPRF